jgi:hypothetical protein
MDISFTCDNCGQKLEVDESGAGMTIPCPTCEQVLTIPLKNEEVPSPSQPSIKQAAQHENVAETDFEEWATSENLDKKLDCVDRQGYPRSWIVCDKKHSQDEGARSLLGQLLPLAAKASCRLCGKNPCGDDVKTFAMVTRDQEYLDIWGICLECRNRILRRGLSGGKLAETLQKSDPKHPACFYLWNVKTGKAQSFVG